MSGTKVAVMRLSALGDLVLMLPLLHRLRDAGLEPHWIIAKSFAPLFRAIEGIRLIEIDKPASLNDYRQLYRRLKPEAFDILLATQANLRVNLLYPAIRAKYRLGFDLARARDGQRFFVNQRIAAQKNHLCDGFLQFADHLQLAPSPVRWQLPVEPSALDWAQSLTAGQAWLAINPSASKAERNWPLNRYIELLQRLHKQDKWQLLLTGGGGVAERQLAGQIEQALPQGALLNLVGQTSLPQLVALLSQVDALIAPDTGPVHIANALGKPVIGLYAVAPAWLTGPYGQSKWVVDCYPQAVRQFLHKDPAKVPIGTRVHHPQAMALIELESVWQKIGLLN